MLDVVLILSALWTCIIRLTVVFVSCWHAVEFFVLYKSDQASNFLFYVLSF